MRTNALAFTSFSSRRMEQLVRQWVTGTAKICKSYKYIYSRSVLAANECHEKKTQKHPRALLNSQVGIYYERNSINLSEKAAKNVYEKKRQ